MPPIYTRPMQTHMLVEVVLSITYYMIYSEVCTVFAFGLVNKHITVLHSIPLEGIYTNEKSEMKFGAF